MCFLRGDDDDDDDDLDSDEGLDDVETLFFFIGFRKPSKGYPMSPMLSIMLVDIMLVDIMLVDIMMVDIV